MKLTVRNLYFPLPRAYLEFLLSQASYRAAMCITEVMVFKSTWMGETGYYVCPRCHITLEREFMSFCDRCGQHLDWKNYKKAAIITQALRNDSYILAVEKAVSPPLFLYSLLLTLTI